MAIVRGRTDWWMEPEEGPDDRAWSPDAASPVVSLAGIRPLGPRSWFGVRRSIEACLNCGLWIHPGRGAWFDPDSQESVCGECWPEKITAIRPR